MDLVDRYRLAQNVAARARFHPCGVAPGVVGERPDDGRGLGRDFGEEAVGIALILLGRHRARARNICIALPRAIPGMKISQMPPSRRRMGWRVRSQPLKSPVTLTTSAFGAHTAKRTPSTPSHSHQVRAQRAIAFVVGAFAVQVQLEGREQGREAVGIVEIARFARIQRDADAVIAGGLRELGREETGGRIVASA